MHVLQMHSKGIDFAVFFAVLSRDLGPSDVFNDSQFAQ